MKDMNLTGCEHSKNLDVSEFKLVFERQDRPVLLVSVEGKILFANSATFEMTGMSSSQISDSRFLKLTVPAFRSRMMEGIEDVMRGKNRSFTIRCMLQIESLLGEWVDIRIERLQHSALSNVAFYVTLERISTSDSISSSHNDLLPLVSHEIRSSLMVLDGALKMRRYREKSEYGREEMFPDLDAAIERITEKLRNISSDLIEYSAMEHGRLNISLEVVEVGEVLRHAALESAGSAAEKGIDIKVDVPSTVTRVWADTVRLGQVVQNIVGNSIKYCPDGSGIAVEWIADKGSGPKVKISDTGPGLPEDVRNKIFSPFNKGHNSLSNRESSGLGLRISQLLMHAMGGNIRLVGSDKSGTVFELELASAEA